MVSKGPIISKEFGVAAADKTEDWVSLRIAEFPPRQGQVVSAPHRILKDVYKIDEKEGAAGVVVHD